MFFSQRTQFAGAGGDVFFGGAQLLLSSVARGFLVLDLLFQRQTLFANRFEACLLALARR